MVRISDLEIIKELLNNSRIAYTDLAKKYNVTESAIRKRIKKLQNEGIIEKYTIEINLQKLGYKIHALIGIDTLPEKYIHIINILTNNENILSLYSSSGDHMIMLEIWLKDSKELSDFVTYLESLDGVTKVCPAVMLEKLK